MRSEKEIFRLAAILAKSIEGELSVEEQQWLDQWLSESEKNRTLYRRISDESFLGEKLAESADIDWKKDYRTFMQKYPFRRRSLRWQKWVAYAAMFVLPLALGVLLWWELPRPEMQQVAENIPVRQQRQPRLTMTEGRQILLSDSVNIRETDGTNVVGETGTLIYEQDTVNLHTQPEVPIYNRLEIPRGAEYALALADGTKIWLNSETVIRYPVSFGGSAREVYVEGEAFFKVAKDSLHPFIVHTGQTTIEVLGTEFNVRNYQEEMQVATTLVEGRVRLTNERKHQTVVLKPGQQGKTVPDGGLEVCEVDTYLYTAWKEGRFVFRSTRMEDLLNTLARWYDLTVFYQNEKAKDIRFTGDMTRMGDFRQLLHIIELNERVRFNISERIITVSLK